MKAVILAAGYAMRLRPLTLDTPKPLLEIGGRKIIDRIIDKISNIRELDSVYVVTNSRFFKYFESWRKRSNFKDRISVIDDGTTSNETRLGAIRDLEYAIRKKGVHDDLLVVAGDNLFEFDIADFLKFARVNSDGVSIALYDIKDRNLARNFGVVKVDEDCRVISFDEKPEKPESSLVSTGIYYFHKDKIDLIENYVKGEDTIDAPGYYIKWLSAAGAVYGFTFKEDWYDIGNIESYKTADRLYSKKERSQ